MKLNEIIKLPILAHMPHRSKWLRRNAPALLASVIAETPVFTSIKSIKQLTARDVSPIGGGMLSACYLIRLSNHDPVVVKLRYDGALAEAEALEFWKKSGASVVKVIRAGTVPSTVKSRHPVKYLVLEGVFDKRTKKPATTCMDYVKSHPSSTRKVGSLLGTQLAKMHAKSTYRTFGEYSDIPGNKSSYKSWASYLIGYVDMHEQFLLTLDIAKADLNKLRTVIKNEEFSNVGRYIHGDFGLRNALIGGHSPLAIKIFDPNPIIGDPSWDMAVLFNNYDFAKRKLELKPHIRANRINFKREKATLDGFIEAYEKQSKRKIDRNQVVYAQIMQTIFLLQIEERKLKKRSGGTSHRSQELEVRARRDNLIAKIHLVTHLH